MKSPFASGTECSAERGEPVAKGKYEQWRTADGLLLLRGWRRKGIPLDKIARDKCGVSPSTLHDWMKRYPEISESLTRAKEMVEEDVIDAVLKRALGYRYTEITRELRKNPETGEAALVVTKEITKEVAPDVAAQKFYLINRGDGSWRNDNPPEQDSGGGGVTITFEGDMQEAAE